MDIAVALGGGGSRGFAHIGVLRALEDEGFRIRSIAGTSMGGLVAAMYAAGYSPQEMLAHASKASLPELLRARPLGPGLVGVQRIERFLGSLLGDRTFEDLRIPLALTAVDADGGREIVLTQGPLVEAILATIAIPGIFPPQLMGSHRLLDGGLIDPVPVAPARRLFRGPVVAVALSPPRERWAERRAEGSLGLPLLDAVVRLRPAEVLSIVVRAVEITSREMTELRLKVDQPEAIIRPAVTHIGLLEAVRVEEVAALGERAAAEAMPQLRALFTPGQRVRRGLRRWLGAKPDD
jgi:NTE family protein